MGNLLRILLSTDPPSKGADIFVDFESKNILIILYKYNIDIILFFKIYIYIYFVWIFNLQICVFSGLEYI